MTQAPEQGTGAGGPPREQGKFVTGSLMRHVTVMALSGTLGLMVTFLVDFLALWWIGQLKQEQLIAAVGIAGTIQFAVISVSIGMMIGAVALIARTIGMGDRPRARRIATFAVILTTVVMSLIGLLVVVFADPILQFSGASGPVLDQARLFLQVSLPSIPLFTIGVVSSSVLRAVGDAWRSTAVVMIGGIVAVFIDPLLIVWMGWGVTGAAVSIVIARAAMAALGLWYVLRVHRMFARPSWADAAMFTRPYLAIALPAIATQMSTPVGSWILTREIAHSGESAVAGWGVVMRLTILAFGGIFALSGAIGGIIGQNYGAGRTDRVAEAFVAALKFCLVYTLFVWAVMAALSGPIATSFGLSAEGEAVVRTFTHFAAGSFIFTGALFVANAAFNNLGKPLRSTWANWSRDGILMYPLAVAGAAWAGAQGVVWAQAVANVLAGVVAGWAAWAYIRSLKRPDAPVGAMPRPAE
jgi:putative MATE family efflux protein